ncbi:MAG: AMP-binding protein [Candidatus Omnitrophica bacterium]|nr:AMP-binding protein [Candidatus Omnitrophota bacterium]
MWEKLSKKTSQELRALQDRKLHYFINNYLYPFSKAYRTLFDKNKINPARIKSVEDLRCIPFTTKEDFLPAPDNPARYMDFLLLPTKELAVKYLPKRKLLEFALRKEALEGEFRPIFLTSTTGTTNQPTPFLYTEYDLNNLRVYGRWLIDIFAVRRDERAVNVFPYAPHLAFWQTVFAGFGKGVFILSTGGGKVMGTEGNIQAIEKIKPSFIIGVPGYVYHILRIAHEQGLKWNFVNKIALGASRVPAGFKQKVGELLAEMGAKDTRIFGTYGFTEARCAWGECPTDTNVSSGYHTYPDKEIFEVIDPRTCAVKAEGEDGELVYTNIDARGSCVLRYRTGDLVRGGIIYSPCPYCGRTVPRISSDITRASNIKTLELTKIKGSLVNFNMLAHILDDKKEVREWQIEIRKKNNDPFEVDELILYLSVKKNINTEKLKEDLKSQMLVETEVAPNETMILPLEDLVHRIELENGNKEKRIIDKRPK